MGFIKIPDVHLGGSSSGAGSSVTQIGGSTPISPDLQKQAQLLGVDPSRLSGLLNQYQASDPPAWDGKETRPRSRVDLDFYKLTGNDLRQFQERALAAGLYGGMSRSQVRFGDHDAATAEVWKQLVERSVGYTAAGQKISPLDALDEAAANPTNPQQPFTSQVMSPVDIRARLKTAAQAAFGEGRLTDEQTQKFIDTFQAQQQSAEQTAYNNANGAGGQAIAAPNVDTAADTFLHQQDPTRYDSHKVVGAMDQIAQLMRGGA